MSNLLNISNNEWNDLQKAISSVRKEIMVAGKKQYIWKERVILKNGQLMPMDEFMVASGERVFIKPYVFERNTLEEVKAAKKLYADTMYQKYGYNWRNEKKGAVITLHSFKSLGILLK